MFGGTQSALFFNSLSKLTDGLAGTAMVLGQADNICTEFYKNETTRCLNNQTNMVTVVKSG